MIMRQQIHEMPDYNNASVNIHYRLNIAPKTNSGKSIKETTLETEGPLSEKDEVKKAEQRTMNEQKKLNKKSGKNK